MLLERTHAVKNVLSAPNVKVVKCCNSGLIGSQDSRVWAVEAFTDEILASVAE